MSQVIEELRRPAPARARAKVARRPVARKRVKTSRRPRSGSLVTGVALLACVTVLSFVFFSVVGNTLLEQSRRDRLRSVERAKEAREEVAQLRRSLNSMSSMAAVDRWASANNFILSGAEIPTEPQVAPAAPRSESRAIVAAMDRPADISSEGVTVARVMNMAPELVVEGTNGSEAR